MNLKRTIVVLFGVFFLSLSVFGSPVQATTFAFTRNLQIYDTGLDVHDLQQFLNAHGFLLSQSGTGSPGDETDLFGLKTYSALVRFQSAQSLPATGYFGPLTRAAIAQFAVGSSSTTAAQTATSNPAAAPAASASSPVPSTPITSSTSTPEVGIPQPLALPAGYTPGYGGGGGAPAAAASTPDTTPPSVSLTAPSSGATVSGSAVTLTATASDNVAVKQVQFEVDGTNIGAAITSSPYSTTWISTGVADGAHTLYAVAEDTSDNYATSSIIVTVDNTPQVILAIATSTTDTTATITWTTNEAASSTVNYGTTTSYGSASTSAALVTSHPITLTGLTAETTYHFQVASADAAGNVATSSDQTFMTYSTQAQSFFSRLAMQPTSARKSAYDTMISGLVNAGVWSELDGLYLFAAADSATALTNLVQSSFRATVVGSPTFAPNAGYTGDNTTLSYLDTGFDPTVGSPNFTLNSGSLFTWKNTNPSDDNGGIAGSTQAASTYLYAPAPPDGHFYYSEAHGAANVAGMASNTGLFEVNRSDSANIQAYVDGAPMGNTAAAASALTAGKTIQFVQGDAAGTSAQIAAGGFGSSLTDADSRNISNYISNYITAVNGGTTSPELLLSSDIVNDGANNFGPWVARLADGRLIAVYSSDGSGQLNEDILYRTSSNNGVTWSGSGTVIIHATNHTYLMSGLVVLSNGTIIVSVTDQANDASTIAAGVIEGTVSGGVVTWGSLTSVPSALTNPSAYGAVLPLGNGQLMQSVYDGNSSNVNVVFSSDGGTTWPTEHVVVTGNQSYSESSFVQLANGTIVGVLRRDGASAGYYMTTSTDNGTTWAAPTLIFGTGAADQPGGESLTLTPSGELFLIGRFTGTAGEDQTGYTYSSDDGATWSTPTIYYNVGAKSYGQYVYGGGFYDSTTQSLMYAIAQGSFSSAEMIFQQFSRPM